MTRKRSEDLVQVVLQYTVSVSASMCLKSCDTHLVIDREMQSLGTVEDLRVFLTRLADRGRVDKGRTDGTCQQ